MYTPAATTSAGNDAFIGHVTEGKQGVLPLGNKNWLYAIPMEMEISTEGKLHLQAMVNRLPEGAQQAAFALGRMQMPWVAQSVLLGGHVRVGLEDNLYLSRGVKATNEQLVARAVELIGHLGSKIATPDEVREMLNLKPQ